MPIKIFFSDPENASIINTLMVKLFEWVKNVYITISIIIIIILRICLLKKKSVTSLKMLIRGKMVSVIWKSEILLTEKFHS